MKFFSVVLATFMLLTSMHADAAKRFGGGKQFVDRVHAQHARAPECCAIDIVCARQRAGVGGRRLRRAPPT